MDCVGLGVQGESAENLDRVLSKMITAYLERLRGKDSAKIVVGFAADSPNVMPPAQKHSKALSEGGFSGIVCMYGCACHALTKLVEDVLKHRACVAAVKPGTLLAHYFMYCRLAGKHPEEQVEKDPDKV